LALQLGMVSPAIARLIMVDPGHGGSERGANPPGCAEADANLNVGLTLKYLLRSDVAYSQSLSTRYTDVYVDLAERVRQADAVNASAFVSVHHNAEKDPTRVEYDVTNMQVYWHSTSQTWATYTEIDLCDRFSSQYGIDCYGVCVDQTAECSGSTLQVLRDNDRPAILGEPTAMWTGAQAYKLCYPATYPMAFDEAYAYFWGVHHFYGTTAVGTSFAAAPLDVGGVRLSWEESDPQRTVVYVISRSDNCWGPFDDVVATVVSHDPNHTSDNMHYTFDTGAPYRRQYWFELRVVDEAPRASVTPDATYDPTPVGVPQSLSAIGTDLGGGTASVTLSWQPGTGTATGYYVYRSQYVGMSDCNSMHEYLGTASGTTFVDETAPVGVPLFYRVRAFNQTTGSGTSADAGVTVQGVVGVGGITRPAVNAIGVEGANPTRGVVEIAYSIARAGDVRVGVFDVAGRLMAEPVREWQNGGDHHTRWDGSLRAGGRARSGVYFSRLTLDGVPVGQHRIVILR
jgi:hypothetical protein